MNNNITLIDNSSLKGREDQFTTMTVDLEKVVLEWKNSLFSFEWLEPSGAVRNLGTLSTDFAAQYQNIENLYQHNNPLERPVLGLGMMDHVEIGSGKDVLLTLYKLGLSHLEVHIPKTCLEDFQRLL